MVNFGYTVTVTNGSWLIPFKSVMVNTGTGVVTLCYYHYVGCQVWINPLQLNNVTLNSD